MGENGEIDPPSLVLANDMFQDFDILGIKPGRGGSRTRLSGGLVIVGNSSFCGHLNPHPHETDVVILDHNHVQMSSASGI